LFAANFEGIMRKVRNSVNIKVGQSLRRIRTERGLSQTEAAKSMRIVRQTLVTMENGRQNISIAALSKIANFYAVKVSTILDGI
jgi:transcriptional regulator with XRE-family HTH domain